MHELPLEGLRVLVIEDEALIALDLEHLCREAGAAEIVIVRDLAALPAGDRGFDVAVLDLVLPEGATLELAAELFAAGVPFVFVTGYPDAEGVAERFPGVAIVEKPYGAPAIVGAIAAAVRRGRTPV